MLLTEGLKHSFSSRKVQCGSLNKDVQLRRNLILLAERTIDVVARPNSYFLAKWGKCPRAAKFAKVVLFLGGMQNKSGDPLKQGGMKRYSYSSHTVKIMNCSHGTEIPYLRFSSTFLSTYWNFIHIFGSSVDSELWIPHGSQVGRVSCERKRHLCTIVQNDYSLKLRAITCNCWSKTCTTFVAMMVNVVVPKVLM